MDKYIKFKEEYDSLITFLQSHIPDLDTEQVAGYFTAAALKIWSGNVLYSPEYKSLIGIISDQDYTMEQLVTAMGCCEDEERRLLPPEFFITVSENDKKNGTTFSIDLLKKMDSLLVAAAMINGDFTIEEACIVSDIIIGLRKQLAVSGIALVDTQDYDLLVTDKNENSYLQNDALIEAARAADSAARPSSKEHSEKEKSSAADASAPANISINMNIVDDLWPGSVDENCTEPLAPGSSDLNGTEPQAPGSANLNGTEPQAPGSVDENGTEPPTLDPADKNEMQPLAPEEQPTVTEPSEEENETMESLLEELDSRVGLDTVKKDVHSLLNFIKVAKLREERGMKVPTISYHLVFTGNPGTGKTTVARLVGKLYYHMGILPKGQLVETDRSALVAGYLGQTAIKTQKVIQEAMGGVLFIDEAYSLAGDDQDSYGKEAIETILKAMEDHRDELVVIVAGYTELMHKFIESNPGLSSRFSKYFEFPDYTGEQLMAIFERFCKKNGYELGESTGDKLLDEFSKMYEERDDHFGNARTARNIFEKAINAQADRIAQQEEISDQDLQLISAEDIETALGGMC